MMTLKLEDILFISTTTHTGKDFGYLIIAWIKNKQDENYELLFKSNEMMDGVPFGEMKDSVGNIEKYFNKKFEPLMFEGNVFYCNKF